MNKNTIKYKVGVFLAGVATLGALLLAGYLLFTDVTTFPGTGQPATGLESGNVFLIAIAVFPVLLTGIGLFGTYHRRGWVTVFSAAPLLILGISGFGIGFYQLAIGMLLLASVVFASKSRYDRKGWFGNTI